jgi:hypothetical protein
VKPFRPLFNSSTIVSASIIQASKACDQLHAQVLLFPGIQLCTSGRALMHAGVADVEIAGA